jgi:hypothetical protein
MLYLQHSALTSTERFYCFFFLTGRRALRHSLEISYSDWRIFVTFFCPFRHALISCYIVFKQSSIITLLFLIQRYITYRPVVDTVSKNENTGNETRSLLKLSHEHCVVIVRFPFQLSGYYLHSEFQQHLILDLYE